MSSLDAIWDEPIASTVSGVPSTPQKRPRQPLFLSNSDSDDVERPSKRATPAPHLARPPDDVNALFEDLYKDKEDEDLRYKPLAPALDLEKLAKEAEARHARARQTVPSQPLAGSSKAAAAVAAEKDNGKGAPGDGEKKGRKVLPKLDEERLVGPDGFPLLIEDIKGFKPTGKGCEHTDLNRLLQVYQFWTHKMYPKMSFKDTVNRVERLCHSKRMQVKTSEYVDWVMFSNLYDYKVRLSVWRDEFRGITKGEQSTDDPDVIDLTEPTLVATEDDEKDEASENPRVQVPSRTPSLPPASSEVDDDGFDIDAVIRAEEERLAALRATAADSGSLPPTGSPTLAEKTPSGSKPDVSAMDVDEASLWEALDDPPTSFEPTPSGPSSSTPAGEDEDMWNIVDEMEQGGRNKPVAAQIPVSGVNVTPRLDSTNSGNAFRATNDENWDEMYS